MRQFSYYGDDIFIEAIPPQNLSQKDFELLNELTQDMWGTNRGLGELVRCRECGYISSKEQAFGRYEIDITKMTVQKIMDVLDISNISCPCCNGPTDFIYGREHIEKIRKRLLESVDSFLTVCRDKRNDIIGFTDGYIAPIDLIFERELLYHYRRVGVETIRNRVKEVLGYSPENMIVFSAMGLHPKYSYNMRLLFRMLKNFFASIPQEYDSIPGIAELDRGSNFCSINQMIGMQSLGILDQAEDTGSKYNSDLVVTSHPTRDFREGFSIPPKQFLRKYGEGGENRKSSIH